MAEPLQVKNIATFRPTWTEFPTDKRKMTLSQSAVLFGLLHFIYVQGAAACDPRTQQLSTFLGGWCQQTPPRTCADVPSGSSPRHPVVLENGMAVLCDTVTDGGGWIVIQRRTDGNTDFYRSWIEYKYGFGTLGGNFWLGNEKISQLTQLRPYQLRIDITFNQVDYYATYDSFSLRGEDDKYRIQLGSYAGNSSDGLGYHNNRQFSTKDSDNDEYETSCAQRFHGAWWYGACHNSNLNGLWGSNNYAEGLTWDTTTGDYASPTFTEMKIRPIPL